MIARPNYTDAIAHKIKEGDLLDLGFDVAEVKYDGRWSIIKIKPSGKALIFSRGGRIQGGFSTDLRPDQTIILLGEHMIGTDRAEISKSLIVVFDCLHDSHLGDLAKMAQHLRRQAAADSVRKVPDELMTMTQQWSLHDRSFADIWQDVVVEQGHEGLVIKRSLDPYSHGPHEWPHWIRVKTTTEHDAMVVGVDGQSILCMVDGVQWRCVVRQAGLEPTSLIGHKVTLRSNGIHKSGKGRHVRFVRVHPEQ